MTEIKEQHSRLAPEIEPHHTRLSLRPHGIPRIAHLVCPLGPDLTTTAKNFCGIEARLVTRHKIGTRVGIADLLRDSLHGFVRFVAIPA